MLSLACEVTGFGLLMVGAWMLSPWAVAIVGGLLVMAFGYLVEGSS
jgi:hypothetical protein